MNTENCAQCENPTSETLCEKCLIEAKEIMLLVKSDKNSKKVFQFMLKACPDMIEYMIDSIGNFKR